MSGRSIQQGKSAEFTCLVNYVPGRRKFVLANIWVKKKLTYFQMRYKKKKKLERGS